MSDEKKVVKGGFRATLALIISIVALIVAIVAFNRTGGEADLNSQIKDLRAKVEKMKKETSERVNKVREETGEKGSALENGHFKLAKAYQKFSVNVRREMTLRKKVEAVRVNLS
jgi:hypothetical protein